MNIQIGKYLLKQAVGAVNRWDLLEEVTRTKKGSKETYGATHDIAFGMELENAIQYIISLKLSESEDTVTLKDYLELYKIEKDKVVNTIHKTTNIKILKHG